MLHVCKEHDDDVMVYEGPYGSECPFCEALKRLGKAEVASDRHEADLDAIATLNEQLDEMRDERDEARETIRRLERELDVFRSQEL